MPTKAKYYYWDSCVFLAFVNKEPDRYDTLLNLWDEIAGKGDKIITSAVSIVEVSHAQQEKQSWVLNDRADELITDMWSDPNLFVVEAPEIVMYKARRLIRDALQMGWSIKPMDAIHLATAMWADENKRKIHEFHTYDDLERFKVMAGFPICEPYVNQLPLLPNMNVPKNV